MLNQNKQNEGEDIVGQTAALEEAETKLNENKEAESGDEKVSCITCADDTQFTDAKGYNCKDWVG